MNKPKPVAPEIVTEEIANDAGETVESLSDPPEEKPNPTGGFGR